MVGHKGSVNGCLFLDNDSSNDKLVASCSSDSTVKIWSTTTGGSVLSEYIGGGAGPISGIVSPSPETLAASTFNEGVYVWKLVSDSSMELKLRAKY
ncbi:PREDICTED: WD repeat-containing protein 31-like isoform X2 [Amphimedon queenslandica]|nr:PREDICTED: WD repeat-containing protein 31-like isoform X2 [Amphimedon queenslandica]|eukprot:XP_003391825.1 PREDICTED: WD repeat-containing protein 31-like isoform X2 [Amphimedon queenslandica]